MSKDWSPSAAVRQTSGYSGAIHRRKDYRQCHGNAFVCSAKARYAVASVERDTDTSNFSPSHIASEVPAVGKLQVKLVGQAGGRIRCKSGAAVGQILDDAIENAPVRIEDDFTAEKSSLSGMRAIVQARSPRRS